MGVMLPLLMLRRRGSAYTGKKVAKSLRFNVLDSPKLTNTCVASPTDNKKWTISFWLKRGKITYANPMSTLGQDDFRINADDTFSVIGAGGATIYRASKRKLTDPTAWYHFVLVWDTANATASERLKVYLNGVEYTNWLTNNTVAQNFVHAHNTGSGTRYWSTYNGANWHFDGLYADINMVDGQKLDPTYFASIDPITLEWMPKAYAGGYGANGYALDFSDSSNTTSSTLGKDRSGNNNDWTPSGFSVAAGNDNDSLYDSPANYNDGIVHGNFCTLSPVNKHSASTFSLANGNLQAISTSAANMVYAIGTHPIKEGEKKVFELTAAVSAYSTSNAGIGVCDEGFANAGLITGDTVNTDACVWKYLQDGNKKTGSTSTAFGSTYTTGDVIMVAVDATNINSIKIWWAKNGVWQASGDPATGANPAYTITSGTPVWPLLQTINNTAAGGDYVNFGQKAFITTVPSGFSAICAANDNTPNVIPANKIDHSARAGTGSAGSKTGLRFQPDAHVPFPQTGSSGQAKPLTTSLRGTGKYRSWGAASAEVTDAQAVTAFNSDGISFGTSSALNANGTSFLDLFLKNDPTNGIEIITWTGDGGATKTISHTLGVKPDMIYAAGMGATNWYLWHKAFTGDTYFQVGSGLSNADQANTNSPFSSFSSSNIVVTNNATNNLNNSGTIYIAIVFRNGPLFRCGGYTGNGSADGPVMWCGFKPLLSAHYNANSAVWLANHAANANHYNGSTADAWSYILTSYGTEVLGASSYGNHDYLSNGFKIRSSHANINQSGSSKYWFALAEQVQNYSRAA